MQQRTVRCIFYSLYSRDDACLKQQQEQHDDFELTHSAAA